KYFGVASATLLAATPAVTPALMTAANLQVVKADTIQDNITAAFKADNSIVPVSAEDWNQLTSINVSDTPDEFGNDQLNVAYLTVLYNKALEAKSKYITNAVKEVTNANNTDNIGVLRSKIYSLDLNVVTVGTMVNSETSSIKVKQINSDNGGSAGAARWREFVGNAANLDAGEKPFVSESIWSDYDINKEVSDFGKDKLISDLRSVYDKLPVWWFVDTNTAVNDSDPKQNTFVGNKDGVPLKLNAKSKTFTPIPNPNAAKNGYVTVVPNGGVDNITDPENASLSFVGDNLVNLQKYTDTELLNLVPSKNRGANKAGVKFNPIAGQFDVSGGKVTAGPADKGSKVWSVILNSVLNPKDAIYPLKDLTTNGITQSRMIVNGKDPLKNEYITKDEIKNADRISIQFILKDNGQNEYKTPTIWLSRNAKYTVNTAGLANITRLPGDFYSPSFGITGTVNSTGKPMDPSKFFVVPAGTDLAQYTDKDNNVDLNALSLLSKKALGSGALDSDVLDRTALVKPGYSDSNYFYSKFGNYTDAIDVYYIEGDVTSTPTNLRSSQSDAVIAAVNAAKRMLSGAPDNSKLDENGIDELCGEIYNAIKPHLNNEGKAKIPSGTGVPSIATQQIKFGATLGSIELPTIFTFNSGYTVKEYNNKATQWQISVNSNDPRYTGDLYSIVDKLVSGLPSDYFKEVPGNNTVNSNIVSASGLNKVVSNAARTTKVDVPNKYLPQISFEGYENAKFYGNGATINNWFNYDMTASASASNKNPYYPNGGVITTPDSAADSSDKKKEPSSYLAPAAFAANELTADQFKARVNENIQKFMGAKLSNPNTETDSKENGYFKSYVNGANKGDASYAYIKNGAVSAEDVTIDTSKVDVTKPGTYYVTVTYAPLATIKNNVKGGNTNGNVSITDANNKLFLGGKLTDKEFGKNASDSAAATGVEDSSKNTSTDSNLSLFDADQIFANGAPATFKLPVQITDGSSSAAGAPVIAFTNGGENTTIAKGAQFDPYKGIKFFAYPGAPVWDGKDSSLQVKVSGQINTNVEGKYTLTYTVTNKAGKVSKLTRVVTVGSGVEKPTETAFNMSPAYIDYVPGYNVREYANPNDSDWGGKQIKHGTSVSVTAKAVYGDGTTWYKLGDGNWVKAEYVKPGNAAGEAVDAKGVVDVSYVPGYGIAVYKEPGSGEVVYENGNAKRLPHGTSWKSFKKQTVNGITYYNVGGNQWVDGRYVNFH
ncbi:immunoglobulin-like domain-containing protein, partial [Lactobacillus sp.]|uniref:immunoglobulin-like domain-containing protein n=1 Tax=Lactobacillus sp. TaxID=1591 RepID=UPI00258D900C